MLYQSYGMVVRDKGCPVPQGMSNWFGSFAFVFSPDLRSCSGAASPCLFAARCDCGHRRGQRRPDGDRVPSVTARHSRGGHHHRERNGPRPSGGPECFALACAGGPPRRPCVSRARDSSFRERGISRSVAAQFGRASRRHASGANTRDRGAACRGISSATPRGLGSSRSGAHARPADQPCRDVFARASGCASDPSNGDHGRRCPRARQSRGWRRVQDRQRHGCSRRAKRQLRALWRRCSPPIGILSARDFISPGTRLRPWRWQIPRSRHLSRLPSKSVKSHRSWDARQKLKGGGPMRRLPSTPIG